MRIERDIACNEIVELVTDYLEAGLSSRDRERFEEHIGYCDWCLTYLEQMRDTIATVGTLGNDAVPTELETRLLATFRDWKQGPE
jgi:putative zinc finger protein